METLQGATLDLETLFNKALNAYQTGDLDAAKGIYKQVLIIDPNHAASWMNLGLTYNKLGSSDKALAALNRAKQLTPDKSAVHYNIGNIYMDQGALRPAMSAYRQALRTNPKFGDASNNLGETLIRQGDHSAAIAEFRRGLIYNPDHLGLLINLGNAVFQEGNTVEALIHLNQAREIAPDLVVTHRNLGNVLRISGRLNEAEETLKRAIELAPNDAESRVLMAFCLFAVGRFNVGWEEYAWRWKSSEHEPPREFLAPFWQGEPLKGKQMLIWGEQAVGDELMFASIYNDLLDVGAEIYIETEFRLRPLFERSFPTFKIFSRRNPPDQALTEKPFDYQIAAGDLGKYLRKSAFDFINKPPFLRANPKSVRAFRDRYSATANGRRLIGISWKTNNEQTGISRSIPIEILRPILTNPGTLFINLQYGEISEDIDKISDFGCEIINDPNVDPLKNMEIAAAQIASLDLVITVANTTAHISGALGIPTYLILSRNPDWRWGSGERGTPWYSSVEFYRQQKNNDWNLPINKIQEKLP